MALGGPFLNGATSSQLTINTAIVYMHRFYMVQSFTQFHRNSVAPAALFLAAKVEEQPRKLEHVIKVAHACLHPLETLLDTRSEAYLQQAQDLVILESIILQTLGFEITIDHPHTHVVKCTQLVRASKDLAQTSYFMATNSLHLTTFSLQYTPPVVACVCIHLACKWSNWEIPVSTDGKHWWEYVDGTVTLELLDELTHEFLQILEKTPNRLKRIRNWRASQAAQKSKADEHGEDESLSEQTILNMISRNNSSDMNIAGLMSMSTSSQDGAGYPKPSGKNAPAAKVSLKEYRAKHAEELAAQKRQLENMEANVRSQYAYAAQNLLVQQQREREVQQDSNPSAIILKIPMGGPESAERPVPDKGDKASALKLRIPVAGGAAERPLSSKQDEIKMRIKVPTGAERHGSSDESGSKAREHKEKHKGHSSNHLHHHHNPAALSLPPAKGRAAHGKLDKGPAGANGHNASQASDYQDTVNMLHSLLSAQGMQPSAGPAFEFHSYGEYLNPRAAAGSRSANTDKPRPPPLPSEPPPPLPPLPK
ncbi:PREDICTED: LOW QUALITY PROTEIN: cyclin-T1 [Tinamus guttatus]|uniref:LOW QUALITY PROTEIN: cyclin-T1 n=1 Tax=Tinamus guttatus TaxID=94827 RepID=UPI00052EBD21|nr:PREDICTED: LOW QUALITY PROTEIN: cyclin-T1 [Tinamus guttatus]